MNGGGVGRVELRLDHSSQHKSSTSINLTQIAPMLEQLITRIFIRILRYIKIKYRITIIIKTIQKGCVYDTLTISDHGTDEHKEQ